MTASAARLADAVSAWSASLDDGQRDVAHHGIDDPERTHWFYWPGERVGLPLAAMTPPQQRAAFDVLAAVVSSPAFAKAATIVAFEDVLRRLEADGERGRRRPDALRRDPLGYCLVVFGDAGSGTWGVRFEGHHVSVSGTVVDGELRVAPAFLGANPSRIGTSLRPLGDEEHLGWAVAEAVRASTPHLVDRMVLPGDTPDDVLTGAAPSVEPFDDSVGVALADLGSGAAATVFEAALRAHVGRVPDAEASAWWRRIEPTLASTRFAWSGPFGRSIGAPHYFRFWHPRLLVEHDNTQNDADHAHNVVRDPGGDFGADVLRQHLGEDRH